MARLLSVIRIDWYAYHVAGFRAEYPDFGGKVTGLELVGESGLYIGPLNSTPAEMIGVNCDWQIDCGDGKGVVDLLENPEAHRKRIMDAGVPLFQAEQI